MGGFFKDLGNALGKATADLLSNSDFVSRTIGMGASYDDIMFIVQALGREPISLLGKDYLYIYDHVRRNVKQGTDVMNPYLNDCPKFTFYKERPTIRFADPMNDPQFLIDAWVPDATFQNTSSEANMANGTLNSYAESSDDRVENRVIPIPVDDENTGVKFGRISFFPIKLNTCDMVAKTNANFRNGKYRTLISRYHTNSEDSKSTTDITQTAITTKYGMSHGRNLLKKTDTCSPFVVNTYDNPYCRVWTHHRQYRDLTNTIRSFCGINGQESLEAAERGKYPTVGFRTMEDKYFDFDGGSKRLDKYGTLNKNGFVNIAPTKKIKDYFEEKEDSQEVYSIKKCMFSIENLAWKSDNVNMHEFDIYGLSPEQKGPLGGRIMWFPPYDLTFSENVNVKWNSNDFIGRGESIYTYTNTERSGNLSFMMLIDHPSIVDYWYNNRRGNKDLDPGNEGGVDNIKNEENTLLRFFAGCDLLTSLPQEAFHKPRPEPEKKEEPEVVETTPPEPEVHEPIITAKKIHCVLYYPNNYSGVDDKNGIVNPIYYLMNGIGTQKYVNNKGDVEDIPTTIDGNVSANGYKGGYEVRQNTIGISVADKPLKADHSIIESSYSGTAQYITDENGTSAITASYILGDFDDESTPMDFKSYKLAKIVGSQALSLASATGNNINKSPYEWYRRRWYYRVDKEYENQRLTNKESYLDIESKGLNGKAGYEAVLSKAYISKAFGLDTEDENTILISFADLFVALEGEKARKILADDCFDDKNVTIVSDLMENKDEKYNITSIRFEGHASYQGYSTSNNKLSDNRALTFKKWMSDNGFPGVENASASTKKQSDKDNVDKGENSSLSTKLWRSASVIIEYEESDFVDAALAESQEFKETVDERGNTVVAQQTVKTEIPNGISSPPMTLSSDGNLGLYGMKQIAPISALGPSYQDEQSKWEQERMKSKENELNALVNKIQEERDEINKKFSSVPRYDNEGEFFEQLSSEDPFLHHLITEKIRYFDPAFHSVSPEGFNARLTFLHQCTRQGSTVGASDGTRNTAYNLAFGRPPVCVLRLGDFYYTKIIIDSISINYEQPQWDLNPEGIGVMPMFAKINLNFKFLGGSDLAGPIARLQNAVSFNYYANTGVYDNRAEMVEYDPDGKGKEIKFKPFSYPDMLYNGPITRSGIIESGVATVTDVNDGAKSNMIGKTTGQSFTKEV